MERTSNELNDYLGKKYHGEAYVSLSKALMTRASAVIPVFPLYAALLYKIMKEKGYPIARRTIAKYREQMNLPVARLRRY